MEDRYIMLCQQKNSLNFCYHLNKIVKIYKTSILDLDSVFFLLFLTTYAFANKTCTPRLFKGNRNEGT